MKVVEDHLKRGVGRMDLSSWDEIRRAYAERAIHLVGDDYQSPSYAVSGDSQAGSREGKIIANVNDYTRDQHDMARRYESLFARAYLSRMGALRPTPYITSSGMAALTTVITMLHSLHGVGHTILVGRRSYFQNKEILARSFETVIEFDEMDEKGWKHIIECEKPLAVFVDTLCNVADLATPPIAAIAQVLRRLAGQHYLVVDNSLMGFAFPWKKVLIHRSRTLTIVGWESLNKYYQYGLDRTTGGVVWASTEKARIALFHARMDAGTIASDIHTAMLPTPHKTVMRQYLARLDQNGQIMADELEALSRARYDVVRARTGYGWNGPHVVLSFASPKTYGQLRRMIDRIIAGARAARIPLVAGSSFGLPNTRIYITARQTALTQMFFRISCGTEDEETIRQIARVIASNL